MMHSRDVIHNFFVRELRLKQDIVPGMEIPLHFQADTIGIYEVPCSELCGLGHFQMRTTMQVMSEADFETVEAANRPRNEITARQSYARAGEIYVLSRSPFGAPCAARLHSKIRLQPRSQSDRHPVLLPGAVLGVRRHGALAADALPHGESGRRRCPGSQASGPPPRRAA